MKKLILLSFVCFFASGILFAQENVQKCGTYTILQKVLDSDPELKAHYEAQELLRNSYVGTTMNNGKAEQEYVVPVVFIVAQTILSLPKRLPVPSDLVCPTPLSNVFSPQSICCPKCIYCGLTDARQAWSGRINNITADKTHKFKISWLQYFKNSGFQDLVSLNEVNKFRSSRFEYFKSCYF